MAVLRTGPGPDHPTNRDPSTWSWGDTLTMLRALVTMHMPRRSPQWLTKIVAGRRNGVTITTFTDNDGNVTTLEG